MLIICLTLEGVAATVAANKLRAVVVTLPVGKTSGFAKCVPSTEFALRRRCCLMLAAKTRSSSPTAQNTLIILLYTRCPNINPSITGSQQFCRSFGMGYQFKMISLLTSKRGKLGGINRSGVQNVSMINGDFLNIFENQSTDPYAQIGGNHVHQTKTCNHFEAMDVQLNKPKRVKSCRRLAKSAR